MKSLKSLQSFFVLIFLLVCTSFTGKEFCDFVIQNVKLFDGNNVFEHANVYVKDGRIIKIETNQPIISYRYKYLVNGTNKTLIPGLINAHVHIQSRDDLYSSAKAGILTVMELLRLEEDSIRLFKELSQKSFYPDFYTSGIGADMPDAVIKFYINKLNPHAPLSIKAAETFIAERVNKKVDFIKIFQDSRLPQKFSDSIFDKLIEETHKNNLLAIVHSETLRDSRYEFNHGADIVAHGWVDSLISGEELKRWKQRTFSVIPTLLVHTSVKQQFNPKNYTLSEQQMIEEIGKLHHAGITILAGSDSPADGLNFTTDFYKELELYTRAGLSPLEVLQTATVNPARIFKLENKGIIKEGISADFFLVRGDLLKDITLLNRIETVWKKGIKISK